MNYNSLPFITITNSLNEKNALPLLQAYVAYASDFLLSELSKMLTGHYKLEGSIQILPNLMTSIHAMERLMYIQAFMIFDANDGYYTSRSDLDSFELRYTLAGEGTLEYEGRTYILGDGDGYFISCRNPHTYYAGKNGWKSTVLHLNGGLCNDFFERFKKDGQYRFSKESLPFFEMMQFQLLHATQKVSPYQEYRINCLIDLLLTELITAADTFSQKEKSRNTEVITALLDHIHSHYSDEIVFEKLAREFGVSRTLLFSEFRRYTGFTPGQYLMQFRIRQAKLLLQNSTLSVEAISARTGFSDAGHFSQIFKKEVGTTPLKFRKSTHVN